MFDRGLLPELERERVQLASFDAALCGAMNDGRLLGQIVFEYGTLLNGVDAWQGLTVLDVGTGRSTLPHWMAAQGAHVVAFDLPDRIEPSLSGLYGRVVRTAHRAADVIELSGSMRTLPLADASIDLATSFSVVEHLDTDHRSRAYVPYDEQRRRLGETLLEMIRVVKPGGLIYVTSECCDYDHATEDRWAAAAYCVDGPRLSAAWPHRDVPELFYDFVERHGCSLVGPLMYDPEVLGRGDRYHSFRGPFFSAFSMLARKGVRT
jgi:SAM-dependent methyltransferase